MILIGVGANLYSREYGAPLNTCNAALEALGNIQIKTVRRSRWYWSVPVPISDQPPFVNAVVEVETNNGPTELLRCLHFIEAKFGRTREGGNAPRVLDLDLLIYNDEICGANTGVILPHPRMHERAFVLRPLFELEPHWTHPVTGLNIQELLARIPSTQVAEPTTCQSYCTS